MNKKRLRSANAETQERQNRGTHLCLTKFNNSRKYSFENYNKIILVIPHNDNNNDLICLDASRSGRGGFWLGSVFW